MTKPRPSVLLVGLDKRSDAALTSRLHEAGFLVARTRRGAAAIVYGNMLCPDLVIATPRIAHLLRGCYPDGPFWVRTQDFDEKVMLHQPQVAAAIIARARLAITDLCSAA